MAEFLLIFAEVLFAFGAQNNYKEIKIIPDEKLPKILIYTLLRRDRTQLEDTENNRRGSLLIGVRKELPYKEVNIEIKKSWIK